MPPDPKTIVAPDRFEDLALEEVLGSVRSLTRKCRVIVANTDHQPDHQVLIKALDALDAAGLTALSTLDALHDPLGRFGALVLTKRSPKVAENDGSCVDVVLHYEHLTEGPNQQMFAPPSSYLYGKGRASVVEKTTNFFYPFGDRKNKRHDILVAHTFPEWEMGIAGVPFDKNYPRTIFQGGEISIPFPQANFQLSGYLTVFDPNKMAADLVPSINNKPWLGRPALTWLCTAFEWDTIEPARDYYKVSFEFQYNADTWDPTVVFNDSRTGRPPAKVLEATFPLLAGDGWLSAVPFFLDISRGLVPAGLWNVPALPRRDFDSYFSAHFGGSPPTIIS